MQRFLQVMPHRNRPYLAPFLMKPQAELITGAVEITPSKSGHRPDACRRVDQDPDDGPIAKSNGMTRIDAVQKPPGVGDRDFGRLAFHDLISFTTHRQRGIENHNMPQHEGIEEPT